MGTTAGDKVLEIDYLVAFGSTLSKMAPANKKKFRYLHLSGAVAETDQEKSLWFKRTIRKSRYTWADSFPTGPQPLDFRSDW